MFRQTDPDLGRFLLRTLTLTICACLLSVSVIGVLANLVPMYAASGPQIPLLQPLDDVPTGTPVPTEAPSPTPSPTPTAQPTTPPPSPTPAPTAQPTKTSTPAPAPTRSASPTVAPVPTATATAAATVTPTATAKPTATSQVTASPTTAPALSNDTTANQQNNDNNTTATTRIAQRNNLSFLPVITAAVLLLLALILVGVLLLRHYIAPEPLPRPRLASGARPWRRTRSPESLAGDRDLAGNPLPLPIEGSPSSTMLTNGWQSSATGATSPQQPPLRLGTMNVSSESFAAAPTQMQPAVPSSAPGPSASAAPTPALTTPSPLPGHDLPLVPTGLTVTPGSSSSAQHRQNGLSSGSLEDTARRPTVPPSAAGGGSRSSSRLKRNFLFPTTSLMPTTGELPVASNLAFPPHGTSPFNGNFLFPTTSLVPAEGLPLSSSGGLPELPPQQLSPQPGQPGLPAEGSARERQTEPGTSALPPWLASLTDKTETKAPSEGEDWVPKQS